jgi:hypothetical protein
VNTKDNEREVVVVGGGTGTCIPRAYASCYKFFELIHIVLNQYIS